MTVTLPTELTFGDRDNDIASVPALIHKLLGRPTPVFQQPAEPLLTTVQQFQPRNVLLLILDGYDIDWYREENPDVDRLHRVGHIHRLSSVVLPTTPVALPTILTGQRHSRAPEFGYLHPNLQRLVSAIGCHLEGRQGIDSLLKPKGPLNPEDFFVYPTTLAESLRASGIEAQAITYKGYSQSLFSQTLFRGANRVLAYDDFNDQFMHCLRSALEYSDQPKLVIGYHASIDAAGHHFGPFAGEHRQSVATALAALRDAADCLPIDKAEETLLILTTDHGMELVADDALINLMDHRVVAAHLLRGLDRKAIPPTGAPLGVMLHLRSQEAIHEVYDYLSNLLQGKAWVVKTTDFLTFGYQAFGLTPLRKEFVRALGDILIFAYPGYVVWRGPMTQKGNHGGLRPGSMKSFLCLMPLAELRR